MSAFDQPDWQEVTAAMSPMQLLSEQIATQRERAAMWADKAIEWRMTPATAVECILISKECAAIADQLEADKASYVKTEQVKK